MTDKTYQTTDFYTAAVLISEGFKLENLTTKEGSRVKTFHFIDSDKLRTILLSYRNGELIGNIRNFKNAVEDVKELLHCN